MPTTTMTTTGFKNQISAFEAGELDTVGFLILFSELIRTGAAFTLEGSYGQIAADLIEAGYLTSEGEVTELGLDRALCTNRPPSFTHPMHPLKSA